MLLSEAFALYKRDVISFRNQSWKTEEAHNVTLKSIINFTGRDFDVSDLSFEHVRQWKNSMESRNLSPITIRGYLIKLRVVLAYLNKHQVNCMDPDQIPLPNRVTKVPVVLDKESVGLCIASTDRLKNKAIVSMLYASGLRISELCGLDKGQIRSDGSFTVVGKGGRARLCFIDQRTKHLLKLYLNTREDNERALFLTDSGTRLTPGTVQETFKTIRKRTGLEVHPHTLRHTFATELLKSNTNLRYVQILMGHSSLQTTQIYLNVTDVDLQEVYNKHHKV